MFVSSLRAARAGLCRSLVRMRWGRGRCSGFWGDIGGVGLVEDDIGCKLRGEREACVGYFGEWEKGGRFCVCFCALDLAPHTPRSVGSMA